MSQATIDGNVYTLYAFGILGKANSDERNVRTTVETLAETSRTTSTIHKKRFRISFEYLTESERDALITSFDKNTFTFIPTPYDSTSYTVKVVNDGELDYPENTTAYFNWSGIVLEIAT